MTIKTNATDRKTLAEQLSRLTGEPSRYLRTPTYAYQVGPYTINRDGSISGDDLDPIRDFLTVNGYIQEAAAETFSAPEALSDSGTVEGMSVCIPMTGYTTVGFTCLLKILYSRQNLINAMTRSECLCIGAELMDRIQEEKPDTVERIQEIIRQEINAGMVTGISIAGGKITMDFPFDETEPAKWQAYAELLIRIEKHSRSAHHTIAKRIEPSEAEMKYFCRNWLAQLGMGGPDQKENRAVLLKHLTGYAAFRTAEEMEAFKARNAAKQKEKQTAKKREKVIPIAVTVEEAKPRD